MNGLMATSVGVLASILVSASGVSAQTSEAPSQESIARYCAALSETARVAAEGFYIGRPIDDVMDGYSDLTSTWDRELITQVIERAYALPAPTGRENIRNMAHVIRQFSIDIHVECYGVFAG